MSSIQRTDSNNRFDAGPPNAHIGSDPKDERSLSNRLAAEEKHEHDEMNQANKKPDPLAPAREHGNEPSQGAKKDADIQREEEEYLRQKDAKRNN